jgi:NADH:ubiquinone oxidoreductase subunit 2 (subunit N)
VLTFLSNYGTMNSYLNDIISNAPVVIVIITTLVVTIVEAARKTRPVIAYYISMTGLAFAIVLALSNLTVEGSSFGGMLFYGGYANFFGALYCFVSFFTVILSRKYFNGKSTIAANFISYCSLLLLA